MSKKLVSSCFQLRYSSYKWSFLHQYLLFLSLEVTKTKRMQLVTSLYTEDFLVVENPKEELYL